jgi:hypothetical protein
MVLGPLMMQNPLRHLGKDDTQYLVLDNPHPNGQQSPGQGWSSTWTESFRILAVV